MKILISFVVFVAMATPTTVNADPWYWPPNTEVIPQNPTSSDIVAITLSGEWPDGCTPNGSAVSVTANQIYFDVILDYPPGTACTLSIEPWTSTESVGPLSPGTYNVYARLIGDPAVPETYALMTEFIVVDEQFQDWGSLILGVECVLFQADSGGVYVLDNNGNFSVGDRVQVRGTLEPSCFTICMQGDGCILNNTISGGSDDNGSGCFISMVMDAS
jgi:hypothetical protein